MTVAPKLHVQEALKLTADAVVDLFELTVTALDGTQSILCMRNGPQIVYQGKTYESMPVRFTGYKMTSDNSTARPKFELMTNPGGVFNTFAFQGLLEGSLLVRRQVLRKHLEEDVPISAPTYWRVSCITQLVANVGLSLELRSFSDIPNQYLPRRTYTPPEFPFVSNI